MAFRELVGSVTSFAAGREGKAIRHALVVARACSEHASRQGGPCGAPVGGSWSGVNGVGCLSICLGCGIILAELAALPRPSPSLAVRRLLRTSLPVDSRGVESPRRVRTPVGSELACSVLQEARAMWQADVLDPSVKRRKVGSVTLAGALEGRRPRVSSQGSCECQPAATAEACGHG